MFEFLMISEVLGSNGIQIIQVVDFMIEIFQAFILLHQQQKGNVVLESGEIGVLCVVPWLIQLCGTAGQTNANVGSWRGSNPPKTKPFHGHTWSRKTTGSGSCINTITKLCQGHTRQDNQLKVKNSPLNANYAYGTIKMVPLFQATYSEETEKSSSHN